MKDFLIFAVTTFAILATIYAIPYPDTDSNIIPSDSEFSKELNECVHKPDTAEIASCATERIVRSLDKLSAQQNLEIFPGFSLLSDGSANYRTGKELKQEVEDVKENKVSMLQPITEALSRVIAGRTLKMKLPDSETLSRALVEGRKKMNKKGMFSGIMGLGTAAAAIVPLVLGKLALLTGKAIIVAKLALVLSGILFFQMFFRRGTTNFLPDVFNNNPPPQPIYSQPASSYGPPSSAYGVPSQQYPYSRSFDEAQKYSQELAYAAQK